jgi:hypothetical protein
MIDSDRAEKLYIMMQENANQSFDPKELEALSVVMTAAPVIKAFGRAFSMIQALQIEMSQLDMRDSGNVIEFAKGQGQIEGVKALVNGFLGLVTKPEEDEDNDSN